MYQRLFSRAFTLIYRITRQQVRFHHLHNQGFKAVVMDMDSKQLKGMSMNQFIVEDDIFKHYLLTYNYYYRTWSCYTAA